MKENVIELPLSLAQRIFEDCWSATSKLESQVIRNPRLPDGYIESAKKSFSALVDLKYVIIVG